MKRFIADVIYHGDVIQQVIGDFRDNIQECELECIFTIRKREEFKNQDIWVSGIKEIPILRTYIWQTKSILVGGQ